MLLALQINSLVETVGVSLFSGSVMEIMIATTVLMKTKTDAHQSNAVLINSDVLTTDNVSH